jgi:hypothetical protein
VAEYWHIGETAILFFRITFFIDKGENSLDIIVIEIALANLCFKDKIYNAFMLQEGFENNNVPLTQSGRNIS